MTEGYLGVLNEASCEKVIEKSRFLGYAARAAGEEEAQKFLARLRALHPLATHVCHAYIADEKGNLMRFSDDGEPQGTAGIPILNVLKAKNLRETAVGVVRYFGGIKLGGGGLVRAYAGAAAEVLGQAEIRSFEPCTEVEIAAAYPEVNALLRALEESSAEVLSRAFEEEAKIRAGVKTRELEAFSASLKNALLGRVKLRKIGEYVHPFPLK